MADTKISDLTAIDALATNDELAVADTSLTASRKVSGTQLITFVEANASHDNLADFVANEHIDWTSTASNFNTSGSVTGGAATFTTYDGVASANLLDKSATETISGAYTFSDTATFNNSIQIPNAEGIIDSNSNEILTFGGVASAVNYIQVINSATGFTPVFAAAGDDTNVGFGFVAKGDATLDITATTVRISAGNINGAGIQLFEDSDNGANYVEFRAPASITTTTNFVLPGADGTNGQALTTDGSGNLTFTTVSGGGGGDLVDDTTPQLGGQLDVNGNAIGDGTNELITFTEDASAVNHINIENEATGSGPIISAAGDDTNIDLNISAKGTGNISVGNYTFDADQTVGAGQDNYVLTYDNAAGTIGLEASAGGGGGSSDNPGIIVDDFYYAGYVALDYDTDTYGDGTHRCVLIQVPTSVTWTRVGVHVTATSASAGTLIHLATYDVDTDGTPGALDTDFGSVAGDTTGLKEITISYAMTPDTPKYLAAIVTDLTSGTVTIQSSSRYVNASAFSGGLQAMTTNTQVFSGGYGGQDAALTDAPDPYPGAADQDEQPFLFFRKV